jgi:hypothetical protein
MVEHRRADDGRGEILAAAHHHAPASAPNRSRRPASPVVRPLLGIWTMRFVAIGLSALLALNAGCTVIGGAGGAGIAVARRHRGAEVSVADHTVAGMIIGAALDIATYLAVSHIRNDFHCCSPAPESVAP